MVEMAGWHPKSTGVTSVIVPSGLVVVSIGGGRGSRLVGTVGLREARGLVPSPGLFSQRVVKVVRWGKDCVEVGGIEFNSSSLVKTSTGSE